MSRNCFHKAEGTELNFIMKYANSTPSLLNVNITNPVTWLINSNLQTRLRRGTYIYL